jgi:hypothetical protein
VTDQQSRGTGTSRWGARQLWPLAAIVALVLIVFLPSTGVGGAVRAGAAAILMVLIPGLLLVRLADREGEWVTRLFGAVVLSIAAYVLFGFVAYELNYRWTGGLAVGMAAVLGVLLLALPAAAPSRRVQVQLGGIVLAASLAVAVAAGAIVTHLVLPAAPVEAAFSLTATGATVTGHTATVSVSITSVGGARPRSLLLKADGVVIDRVVVSTAASSITLRGTGTAANPVSCASRLVVAAPNGAFLSPVVACPLG